MSTSCSPLICVLASFSLGITWLVFIPFSIYKIYQFYVRRHYSSIRCRNPEVTLFACAFNLVALIVHDTFYYLGYDGLDINFLSTPIAVACDEAVNLANKYSDTQGRKFINGVLRKLQTVKSQ